MSLKFSTELQLAIKVSEHIKEVKKERKWSNSICTLWMKWLKLSVKYYKSIYTFASKNNMNISNINESYSNILLRFTGLITKYNSGLYTKDQLIASNNKMKSELLSLEWAYKRMCTLKKKQQENKIKENARKMIEKDKKKSIKK